MDPKKRPYYDVERHNSKKRSYDSEGNSERNSEGNGIIEAKRRHLFIRDKEKREIDKYCWICHKLGQDTNCNICMRVYHDDCLTRSSGEFNDLWVCPECQLDSLDGTTMSKHLIFDKLKQLLQTVTIKAYEKTGIRRGILIGWPENFGVNKLAKIVDFEILLDDINHGKHYAKTTDFYSDIKFMYHNCCIMYGADSEQARAAEQLTKNFKKELLDLESCPECYFHLYCRESNGLDRFVRLCDHPHDIVWAQLTGHPYWPAKCLKVAKGIAHVRFFGEHEVSDLPLKKIFHISESHPNFKNSKNTCTTNSGPKSVRYKAAIMELEKYIKLYNLVCGEFPYYPHRTYYKPGKSQEVEAEVISNAEDEENQLSYGTNRSIQLKLEGNSQEKDSSTVQFIEDISMQGRISGENNGNSQEKDSSTVQFTEDISMQGRISGENNDNPLNSSVTTVDLTFTTVEPDPIVTGITLWTDCCSRSTTANESINDLDNILKTDDLNSMREIAVTTIAHVGAEHSEGTILSGNPMSLLNPSINLVQGSSTISSQIPIADRNSEPIPAVPDEAQTENSNASNPSESMDDEVMILDPPVNDPPFNPAHLVLFILEQYPELKKMSEYGESIVKAIFLCVWAHAQNSPFAQQIFSKALGNWTRFKRLYRQAGSEISQLEVKLKEIADKLSKSQEELRKAKMGLKYQTERCKEKELKHQTKLVDLKTVYDDLGKQLARQDKKWAEKYNALLIQMEEVTKERDKLKTEQSEKKSRSYRGNDYVRLKKWT